MLNVCVVRSWIHRFCGWHFDREFGLHLSVCNQEVRFLGCFKGQWSTSAFALNRPLLKIFKVVYNTVYGKRERSGSCSINSTRFDLLFIWLVFPVVFSISIFLVLVYITLHGNVLTALPCILYIRDAQSCHSF